MRFLEHFVGPQRSDRPAARTLDVFNVKKFGAAGRGTDDVSAINEAIAVASSAGGGFVIFPPGLYGITSQIIPKSNVILVGPGWGASTILLLASYTAQAMLEASGISNAGIVDLTVDAGDFVATGSYAIRYTSSTDIVIERISVARMGQFGVAFNGVTRGRIAYSKVTRTTAVNTQNQGILVADSLTNVDIEIIGNRLINTAIDFSGSRSVIRSNKMTDWKFGAGVTTEISSQCHTLVIEGNHCIGGIGTDVNAYNVGGVENWAPRSVIKDNVCSGNAGSGMDFGGSNCLVEGNVLYDNGVIGGSGIHARYFDATVNASNSVIQGNRCFDTNGAGGTQTYGYTEQSALLSGIVLGQNNFVGNKTAATNILSATTKDWLDQSVKAAASPQFAGLTLTSFTFGLISIKITGVNFNSANTDNAITITLPGGFTRYLVNSLTIDHASASLTTATCGLFTATGAGGTAIVNSASAITVSTASENTNNNAQQFSINNSGTQSYNQATLQFRVQTAQGSAATADVTLRIAPVP